MRKRKLLTDIMIGLAMFVGGFAILAIVNFQAFLVIVNILWLTIFLITLIFIVLGVLTFLGRKEEASKIIDMVLEGSITLIDIVDFIKDIINTFVEIVTDFLMLLIPQLAYLFAVTIYLLVLVGYKFIGARMDVTVPTILLAFGITIISGLLTLPKAGARPKPDTKLRRAIKKFRSRFVDSFEVVIFILFLTIDSTHLFFLPPQFNIPLEAEIGNYDLMVRGFDIMHDFEITVQIIVFALALELLRQIIKLMAVALNFYRNPTLISHTFDARKMRTSAIVKAVLNKTVQVSKDDFLMFASFTVFITAVFLLFPRLKLVALISASLAALLLDLIFRQRLVIEQKEDLLSRTFQRLVGNRVRSETPEDAELPQQASTQDPVVTNSQDLLQSKPTPESRTAKTSRDTSPSIVIQDESIEIDYTDEQGNETEIFGEEITIQFENPYEDVK